MLIASTVSNLNPLHPARRKSHRRAPGLLIAGVIAMSGVSAFAAPPAMVAIDFDGAMKTLNFDPVKGDGNGPGGLANGIADGDEMALVGAILANPSLDLKTSGGIDHASVEAAVTQAQASAAADLKGLIKTYPKAPDVAVGYALLGEDSFKAFNTMTTGFVAPLKGDYSLALKLGRFLSANGDADGDGVSNRDEYAATIKDGRAAYIRAALDPKIKPTPGQTAPTPVAQKSGKTVIGIVLYPGFEVLDVFGPTEMWANVPDFQVVMISQNGGMVRSAQGVSVATDYSFKTTPALDVIMVPGGLGTRTELENPVLLNFLREEDKQTRFTTSVCTGSALLAKAGLLKGHRATSNKAFFSLATQQDSSVDWAKSARWVEDGKFLTSSGVSAGTDMALGLVAVIHGKAGAHQLARSLEYQWNDDAANDPFALH